MSLNDVLNENTIKGRLDALKMYLKTANIGNLPDDEAEWFRHIFCRFYSPDDGERKFNFTEIDKVIVMTWAFNTKCFSIEVGGIKWPTTIKRLAGSVKSSANNLTRAMRKAINPQIIEFRKTNILDPLAKCPITGGPLGSDAEVDHIIPFAQLQKKWLSTNAPTVIYDLKLGDYILTSLNSEWINYHRDHAELRYLSKEGNISAHLVKK